MGTQESIGKILDGTAQKDAIHIAVAPVFADTNLMPGQHVGVVENERMGLSDRPIGIVDPFLKDSVQKGQQFFLFLYPNTITGLRHEWTHPLFSGKTPVRSEAEKRLHDFAAESDMNYWRLMSAAEAYLQHGEYVIDGGRYEGWGVYAKFWEDYETVTGKKVRESERGSFFSCSC